MANYRQTISELMERKMSRSEFLRYLLLALIGLVGISRIIESFSGQGIGASSENDAFGSGAYGGRRDGH